MTGDAHLGYSFDPNPAWVQAEHEAGRLSSERRDVLLALVHRVNVLKLRRGKPTPELRLETLACALHRPTDPAGLDALRRLLGRMRQDGELDYTTRGGRHRVVYVFTLTLDRSGVSPGNQSPPGPSSDKPSGKAPNGILVPDRHTESEKVQAANSDTGPGETLDSPSNDAPSTPLRYTESADAETVPGPGCSDIQEDPSTSLTESEASARAREEGEDSDEDAALFDGFWADTRGAYSEPGS